MWCYHFDHRRYWKLKDHKVHIISIWRHIKIAINFQKTCLYSSRFGYSPGQSLSQTLNCWTRFLQINYLEVPILGKCNVDKTKRLIMVTRAHCPCGRQSFFFWEVDWPSLIRCFLYPDIGETDPIQRDIFWY